MPVSDNAATFLGINNENEFYSAHYLAEVFKGDINDILADWKTKEENEEHYQAPPNRLKALSRDYFAMRERSQRERNHQKAVQMQRSFFQQFCTALDIPYQPINQRIELDKNISKIKDDIELPLLANVNNKLWVLGALDAEKEGIDPLLLEMKKDQFIGAGPHADKLKNTSWYELINNVVFKQNEPPRWVMLLSDRQCILIDRYKWLQNRLLRFDLDEILGRKDTLTLQATAALLHTESLLPEQGSSLLDNLDENSHKHAFGVSEDLKYALREAIELLGNEAAQQLVEMPGINFTGKSALDANALSRECLRYMYRLLFIFYIEARPELKYVPHQSEAYRKGYSLESLRDLELVKLTTDESRHGLYFHHSIRLLFKLIHEGYHGTQDADLVGQMNSRGVEKSFHLEQLDSHLFDPKHTPYINKVKFSNQTLQTVIKLMSLTRETTGRGRKRRGRVSYAQLGINQLGAVYEALLSYRGFFAAADLYEVKKANEKPNDLETGYFVTAEEIGDYKEDEKVYDEDENRHKALRLHPKGKFIYRLAGRDREKSASYYTPEVLTQCLVKYTLKERLKGLTADEILNLTICEPAMGSAAFLNEAVNQLSEAYLTLKQQELNKRINHEEYREVLQQVKMHIADHNVYGVDLNPVAVELAEVSLWLNALSQNNQVPWFGYQLFNGNSLIGARRQVYRPNQLTSSKKDEKWYSHEPKRLDPLNPNRDNQHIYHFLLPDDGMAGVKDKEAKKLKPKAFERIKNWKSQFLKPFDADEIKLLQQLSQAIDELWQQHTQMLRADRARTEDKFAVWGKEETKGFYTTTEQKDQIRSKGIFNNNAKIASSYRRLKLVMDYWCALWFWPIDQVHLLPDRSSWLFELNLILQGEVYSFQPEQNNLFQQAAVSQKVTGFESPLSDMFANELPQQNLTEQEKRAHSVKTAKGELHLEKLLEHFPRLKLVNQLAEKYKFFHWELTFADVFADEGGFDIMLGNPPWLKVEWNESGVLGDSNPQFVLQKLSATKLRDKRKEAFERDKQLEQDWFNELTEAEGTQSFLNAMQNYPELKGIQANLYKCFLPQAWHWGNEMGVSGFLHPEGVYDDPKGGALRAKIYPRLKSHYQFTNVKLLFSEVMIWVKYSINVYTSCPTPIKFDSISNIFDPITVERCYQDIGKGQMLRFKDTKGNWETSGNLKRIIKCDLEKLSLFPKLYDGPGTPALQARFPAIHSQELISVLEKFAAQPKRLGDLKGEYYSLEMWHETNAQNDGTIKRQTQFPESSGQWILSGPHFFVGTPFYKTPRALCNTPRAYDPLSLVDMPKNYLPRTNYIPSCSVPEYQRRVPRVPWIDDVEKNNKKVTDFHRLSFRAMLNQSGERTLIPALIPKGVAHMNGVRSYCYNSSDKLLSHSAFCMSLLADFLCKSTGKANLHQMLDGFLWLELKEYKKALFCRILGMSCISDLYSELWVENWSIEYSNDNWTTTCELLNRGYFKNATERWQLQSSLRTDFERRQALLEIDVLVALEMALNLSELLTIYRVQFPVLQQNELDTYFDVNGRIVFTINIGLAGVGLPRTVARNDIPLTIEYPNGTTETKALGWEDICPEPAVTEKGHRVDYASGNSYGKPKIPDGTKIHRTVIDDTLPGGPREKVITYVAPFYLPNREEDYSIAWEVFTERFESMK